MEPFINPMPREKSGLKVQVHIWRKAPATGDIQWLLLQRTPSKGSIWQPVTGNVEKGEPLEECARREVLEETGLGLSDECREVGSFRFNNGKRDFEETIYVANAPDQVVKLSWEHADHRWCSLDDALALIHFESNRDGLRQAMQALARA